MKRKNRVIVPIQISSAVLAEIKLILFLGIDTQHDCDRNSI